MISLGVDIGGTGAKCVAFRDDGEQLALSYIEYPNPPGKVNLEAEVLSASVVRVIRDCVDALPDKNEVAAITVSSFGESFVPVDADGKALTDIIMYFADSSSGEFDALVEKVGAEKFMQIARIMPDASYSLAKMMYTTSVAERPVWKFLFIAGYVCYRLSGNPVSDVSLACRSLLYDVKQRCWSQELLAATGFTEDQMPTVYESGSDVGPLLPEVADTLGGFGFFPGLPQRRKQDRCENRNDGDHDEEFDQSKTLFHGTHPLCLWLIVSVYNSLHCPYSIIIAHILRKSKRKPLFFHSKSLFPACRYTRWQRCFFLIPAGL